jgi:hypothetical protein
LNLYVRSAAGVQFVGTVQDSNSSFDARSLNNSATALSSDGKTLLFSSTGPVTDAPTNGNEQVYRYDSALGQTTCLTCGTAAKGSTIRPYNDNSTPAPTSLLDDGTVVVTTADAHSPRDTNGKNDVYSYRDGAWSLMSDGTSKYGTTHVGTSADGEDIYIMTRSALVGQDNDTGNTDIYDVRRNGGFAEAVPAPGGCLSDACQPMPAGRPAAMAPATDRVGGGGDVPAPVRATLSARRPSTGQLRALARGKVVVLAATVSRPGLVRATLTGVTAGTTRRLATVSATAKRAGNVRLRLRLSSAGQRLLRTRRSLQTTLSFTVAGAPLLRLSSLRLDRA